MTFPIESFSAKGIAGGRSYTLAFSNNGLPVSVVVGPNGTGKSNLLLTYYLFITCQWMRLSLVEFDTLKLTLRSGKVISVSATDMLFSSKDKSFPASIARAIESLSARGTLQEILKPKNLTRSRILAISQESGITPSTLESIKSFSRHDPSFFDLPLIEVETQIRNLELGRVLYLPTFRRIERDIREFVPEAEDLRPSRTRRPHAISSDRFIELIKFGMDDVDQLISDYLSMINGRTRQSSSTASQEYIRDIVSGQIEQFSVASLNFEKAEVSQFVQRLDSELLQPSDKDNLQNFIEKSVKRKQGKPPKHEQYLAYFVYKMYRVFEEARRLEEPLARFKDVLNGYFSPDKVVVYDFTEVKVRDTASSREIALDNLSSGEKQIFAVFAYLLFSMDKKFIVLIDEPELSLSVPWQKRFLFDMYHTSRCSQIFSVTHSPFIVSGELEKYMVDVRKLSNDD